MDYFFFSNFVAFSQYLNFIEEECKEWPVQKCSVASELVKKFTPETKCHKEPKELCASGCGFVQGPEECYDKKETIIHDVSEMTLHCCRFYLSLIFYQNAKKENFNNFCLSFENQPR